MRIKMLQTAAGPTFSGSVDKCYDCPDDVAKNLVDANAAVQVDADGNVVSLKPSPPKSKPKTGTA